jgi:uncharacterized membrane protein (UPF0182 family)
MAFNFQSQPDFPLNFKGSIPAQLGGYTKWGVLIVAIIALFAIATLARSIYTDWLWFGELGFRSVFVKVLTTRVLMFLAGAVGFGIISGVSLYFAHKVSHGPEEIPLPPQIRDVLRRLIFWGTVAGAALLSIIFGVVAASQWEIFLRFSSASDFGILDPLYSKDVAFYVFDMPMYEFLQSWLLGAVVVTLLATLGIYFVNFSYRGVGIQLTPGLKAQVSILAAIAMVIFGAGMWLDRWALVLSDQGAVFGASYTDINARRNALMILTIVAGASSVLMLVNAYMAKVRLLFGAIVLFVVLAVVLGVVWPNAMQRLTVRPNEYAKEQIYIDRNIELTRQAFGLSDVSEQLYPVDTTLTAEMVSENLQTIDNIRLWDHGPLSDVYRQIQLIRPYYDFEDADVDRYTVNGRPRQVMLAAREVAPDKLDEDAQTWVNRTLRYTHGFGVAMSPVTEFTAEGRPEFFAKDIPQDGTIAIGSFAEGAEPDDVVTNPRIYYGEKTLDYVIVNSNTPELDYQAAGGELLSIQYDGAGGVNIGGFFRRLAYAWQFTDINILITGEITDDSRLQYRREIQERVSTVAPFLRLDEDPYIVAADGALYWIQDAYTVTDRYPYSAPSPEGFNYIRNSVKIVIDAFNGSMDFYVWDMSDPIIVTYRAIFPDLFVDKDTMSEALLAHTRYPQDIFGIQAEKYLRYHMLDSQDFYNLEDIWAIPEEKFGQGEQLVAVEPYYVIMKIPGEEREEFVLLTPYTRNDPPIMAGWLAARNDGEKLGELVAFRFPKGRQIDSPQQIEAKIDNDPDISQWFTLRCQEGSFCIRGNLLVIPIATEDQFGLLYAEPVYLQAEGIDFPELKQVILASGDKVVMEGSVTEAVAALTGYTEVAVVEPDETTDGDTAPVEVDAFQANIEMFSDAIQSLREGLQALEDALKGLEESGGGN